MKNIFILVFNVIALAPLLSADAQETLKIVNWNVLYAFNHGKAADDGAKWISDQKADVIALQELNGMTTASLNELANENWQHPHSAILKERGFPVGLTSTATIEVIKRQVDGFHHGYLHCKTHNIHFFVIHFWPGKDHEGKQIAKEIETLIANKQPVILLGDFNTHSKRDAQFLLGKKNVKSQFNVVDGFEQIGMVDLVAKHSPQQKYSFPSPATIPRWSHNRKELETKRQRIDFIFACPQLAPRSAAGKIVTTRRVETISDHYPIVTTIVTNDR